MRDKRRNTEQQDVVVNEGEVSDRGQNHANLSFGPGGYENSLWDWNLWSFALEKNYGKSCMTTDSSNGAWTAESARQQFEEHQRRALQAVNDTVQESTDV